MESSKSDVLILSAYAPKQRLQITFKGPGRTKQAHKDECDINQILARYRKTGVLDFAQRHEPQYGDVTAIDFQAAMNTVANANSMFANLPAHMRARFHNSAPEFLAFVGDPENREEAEKLGLLKAKPEVAEGAPAPLSEPEASPPEEPATPPAPTE